MRNKFDALGFAAAECRTDLAEFEVIEAGVAQSFEGATNFRMRGEKLKRLGNTQVEDLGNVFAAPLDIERLAIKPRALASLAGDDGGREEVHLELDGPGAFALRAAALRAVEGKAAGTVAAQASFGSLREDLADIVEEP